MHETEKKKHGTISMILMLTRGKLNTSLGSERKAARSKRDASKELIGVLDDELLVTTQ